MDGNDDLVFRMKADAVRNLEHTVIEATPRGHILEPEGVFRTLDTQATLNRAFKPQPSKDVRFAEKVNRRNCDRLERATHNLLSRPTRYLKKLLPLATWAMKLSLPEGAAPRQKITGDGTFRSSPMGLRTL